MRSTFLHAVVRFGNPWVGFVANPIESVRYWHRRDSMLNDAHTAWCPWLLNHTNRECGEDDVALAPLISNG